VRCRQSGDRHPIRRTGDIVETDLVAEDDAGRLAAMLAADTEFDLRSGLASFVAAHLDQLADAGLVDGDERVIGEDVLVDIKWQELARIVARQAVGGLGQVVGAEGEELCPMGTFYLLRVKRKIVPCKISKLMPLPVFVHTRPASFIAALVSLSGESQASSLLVSGMPCPIWEQDRLSIPYPSFKIPVKGPCLSRPRSMPQRS